MGDFFTNPSPSPLETFSPTVWFLVKVQFLVPVYLLQVMSRMVLRQDVAPSSILHTWND